MPKCIYISLYKSFDIAPNILYIILFVVNCSDTNLFFFNCSQSDHTTPLLRDLHWLRVPLRIEFKLAVLVFHCLHGMARPHLARELCRVADMDCRRRLRSASTLELHVPPTHRVTVGDRVFAVSAARVWNGLPSDVITSPSLIAFKRRLKTLIYSRSFDL